MHRLLIVDDEKHICKLYHEVFTREKYIVDTAGDLEAARKILDDNQPDLIILDIEIDEENGLNFLKYVKSNRPHIPVILNSAYSIYKSDFHSWSADAYVVKTSDLQPLILKVRECIHVDIKHAKESATE